MGKQLSICLIAIFKLYKLCFYLEVWEHHLFCTFCLRDSSFMHNYYMVSPFIPIIFIWMQEMMLININLQIWLKLYWYLGICLLNCLEHEDMESYGMWREILFVTLLPVCALMNFCFYEDSPSSWWWSACNYFPMLQSQWENSSSFCNWWNDPHVWYPCTNIVSDVIFK